VSHSRSPAPSLTAIHPEPPDQHSQINLHPAGHEIAPHAANPVAGTADLCLIAATPLPQVIDHLQALNVTIIEGPVTRTGARGELRSVYLRDPDGNLVEISNYGISDPG
jgi:catechol 2,3-dioxygenase-like lactoylglutathione lyase family enzyme